MLKKLFVFWVCLAPFFVFADDSSCYVANVTAFKIGGSSLSSLGLDDTVTGTSFVYCVDDTVQTIHKTAVGSFSGVGSSGHTYSSCTSTSTDTLNVSIPTTVTTNGLCKQSKDSSSSWPQTSLTINITDEIYDSGTTNSCDNYYETGVSYYTYASVQSAVDYENSNGSLVGAESCVATYYDSDGDLHYCEFSSSSGVGYYVEGETVDDDEVWLESEYTGAECSGSDSDVGNLSSSDDVDSSEFEEWTGAGQCYTADDGGSNCYAADGSYVPDTDPDHPDNGGNLDGDSTNDPLSDDTGGDDSGTTEEEEEESGGESGDCDSDVDDCTDDETELDDGDGDGGDGDGGDGTCEGTDCCDVENLVECLDWSFGEAPDNLIEIDDAFIDLEESNNTVIENISSSQEGDGYFTRSDLLESAEAWVTNGQGSIFNNSCSDSSFQLTPNSSASLTLDCSSTSGVRDLIEWFLGVVLFLYAYHVVVNTLDEMTKG